MKFILICVLSIATAHAQKCEYGKTVSCDKNSFCINIDQNKMECQRNYNAPLLTIIFPFNDSVKVVCDQGPLSPPSNSHTWLNTAFAVDLQSDRSLKDVSVLAGASGKIIAYDECQTENDQCGLGFGNSVKILTEDGHLLFYAHLKRAIVKTGSKVIAGEKIGIEGTTGWTGKENRHLHLSLHHDWRTSGFEYWKQVGFLPPSIPFKLKCPTSERDIRNLHCRRSSTVSEIICGP